MTKWSTFLRMGILLLGAVASPLCPYTLGQSTSGRSTSPGITNDMAKDSLSAGELFVQQVPAMYATVFRKACEGFPELNAADITLKFTPINTAMQAQPRLQWKRIRWKYVILLNNDPDFEGIHFADIPDTAKVGIIAHELCHLLDYHQKSTWQIIGTGLRYLSKKGKERYEKEIDRMTIARGYGMQLKAWAQFAMYDSKASPAYKAFKKKLYLQPEQIDSIMLHSD